MKRILLILCLLCLSFLSFSCQKDTNKDDDNTDGEGETNEKLDVSKTESETKMEQLGLEQGYMITIHVKVKSDGEDDTDETINVGFKDNIHWVKTNDGGSAYKIEGDTLYYYEIKDLENPVYVSVGSYKNETVIETYKSAFPMHFSGWLYFANTYDGLLTKGADTTICGRPCATYSYHLNSDLSLYGVNNHVNVDYSIAVDKEYGITMKVDFTGSDKESSGAVKLEVTEFKVGSSVVLPKFGE